jgi:hypothetical protein
MAVKFEFLSPGVNIREIDNSVLPADAIAAGPILIGRSRRGPAMQPIRVRSYEDFVDVFGAPVIGSAGANDDIWRSGFLQSPQYAAIAAQAHLASETSPVTFVRLLGDDSTNSPRTGTKPGWSLATASLDPATNRTAYGLFLVNSASYNANQVGALGAIFYVNSGFMALTGTIAGTTSTLTSSAGTLIKSIGGNKEFKLAIYDTTKTLLEEVSFNFNRSDNSSYIRSQFSTNPVMTNSDLVESTKTYWLGESFDRFLGDTVTNSDAGEVLGLLLPLASGSFNWADHNEKHTESQTGWVFAQDQGSAASYSPENAQKLFRFVSLHGGSDVQSRTMVGISNISMPVDTSLNNFPTFNVEIMDLGGNVLEEFTNIDLNPQSDSYIVKKIGNTKFTWNEDQKRYTALGDEPNLSNYIRVEVDGVVDAGSADGLAPFGFYGPVRPKGFAINKGSGSAQGLGVNGGDFPEAFVVGKQGFPFYGGSATDFVGNLPAEFTGSFKFPQIALRTKGEEGDPVDEYDVYYGIRPMQESGNSLVDDGFVDYVRKLNSGVSSHIPSTGGYEYSFIFSLDDLVVDKGARTVTYTSGSRASGTSYTSTSGSAALLGDDSTDTSGVAIRQFVMPIWGGFDGLDVTEKEPFRNTLLNQGSISNSALLYSIVKATDSIRNSEQVIANALSIPGITNTTITNKVISMCEDRKDLLGIIDLADGYVPASEGKGTDAPKVGNVDTVIRSARTRKLNSSYACTFYPWVQINANTGVDSGKLWAPPSVAAVGAFANSDRQSDLWFAPAGFTRGGLNPLGGVGGPGVVNVDGTLTAKERDRLYQININPIASFPGEGIVVFGQKTLQATPSALDRINVRRLLIYLKGELSRISRSLLFEPNVTATWLSFKTQADQVLSEVKANFGVTEYKIVLDETTTTADLIDRNILYAKVFIKPTRAIEYIVVDLIVTNTGAEFV